MKCGRPRPLWAPTAEGVFRVPRRLQERGTRVARARRIGRAPRGCREVPGLRRRDGGRLWGFGAPFRVTSSAAVGRGARDSRRRPARWPSRCAVSGNFIGRCGTRCTGLAPAACAAGLTVDGFGAGGRGTCADGRCRGVTVRRWGAHRRAFRFPRSARAATAVPRSRRHRPVHGRGHGAPHRPRGCSTAQPGC